MPSLLIVHDAGPPSGGRYLVDQLRPLWESMGCRTLEVRGTGRWPVADGVLLHVDRSVVPQAYAKWARRYPRHWNTEALDIRKDTIRESCLDPDTTHDGPVIVKTNLNHAGRPEHLRSRRRARPLGPLGRWWVNRTRGAHLLNKTDYRIYAHPVDVPQGVWKDPRWVVQPFRAERQDSDFLLREYYFVGDAECLCVEASPDPVFTSGRLICQGPGPAPAELRALRGRLGLDYGKIDYILCDGRPFIFDVNKTIGCSDATEARKTAQLLAWGLFPEWSGRKPG